MVMKSIFAVSGLSCAFMNVPDLSLLQIITLIVLLNLFIYWTCDFIIVYDFFII